MFDGGGGCGGCGGGGGGGDGGCGGGWTKKFLVKKKFGKHFFL